MLQRDQGRETRSSPLRSVPSSNRRLPQDHSASSEIGSKKRGDNEALAEEPQRKYQKKERGSRVTPAALAPQGAASASHEWRETPIEPDPNPMRRLFMKSASSAASGSGANRCSEAANRIIDGDR